MNKSYISTETKFNGKYSTALTDTLFQAYRPYIFQTIVFLIIGLLGRLLLLFNANLIGLWIDSISGASHSVGQRGWLELKTLGFNQADYLHSLVWVTSLGFLMTVVFRVGISRLSVEAVSSIYDETTYRTSRLPISFFDRNPAGRVMTRFSSDYNNIFRIFGGPLAEFLGLIFDLISMTVLITIASWWFLPLWILLGLLNWSIYKHFVRKLRFQRREISRKRSPAIAHFSETAGGIATIRAFCKEGSFKSRFSSLNDDYLDQRAVASSVFVQFSLLMNCMSAVCFLFTAIGAVWLVKEGRVTVGQVGVAFAYFGLSAGALQSFFEWLGQFEEAMTGLERMNEYLRLPLEAGSVLPGSAKFETGHTKLTLGGHLAQIQAKSAAIEISNLSMRYQEDLPLALNSINLSIAAGERLAIVGRTGSGKTSLVQALFHLYPFENGLIKVAGKVPDLSLLPDKLDQNIIPLDLFRSKISYITQDPILFVGTLRDNLSGPIALKDSLLTSALSQVQFLSADATEMDYLKLLGSRVEEKGKNFSTGERQLICMARCLLQDTPIVVLDEATSSVDPRSEEVLTRATENFFKLKTQIIIAHRLSTIRSCDRVLWLDQGKVKLLGPPKEVLPIFERAILRS